MKSIKYQSVPKLIIWLSVIILASGCKKFVEVQPPVTFVTSESAFLSNQTAIAELNGLYAFQSSDLIGGRSNFGGLMLSLAGGLGSDELKINGITGGAPLMQALYQNELNSEGQNNPESIWATGYTNLFQINSILEGLYKATTSDQNVNSKLTPGVKKQLLGEAKFMRAFIYFYLVNCYGDVPLITSTDYKLNNLMPRTDKKLVYEQMERDLLDAESLLSANYVNPDVVTSSTTSERTRPIKWAAAALLSRVYLYMGKYADAETQASLVIGNANLYSLVAPNGVFLKNSKEIIFAFQPVEIGYHSNYRIFLLPPTGPTLDYQEKPHYLNENLIASFEPGDPRLHNWINNVTVGAMTYYYSYKYKAGSDYDQMINQTTKTQNMLEYNIVLRLAEQYLIRAEARARNNNLIGPNGAIADINAIRTRARNGAAATILPNLPETLNQIQVLDAISLERRHELFTEWGDRWFDLKRVGKLDAIMKVLTPLKSNKEWNPNQALYPIARDIIRANPNLKQNTGY